MCEHLSSFVTHDLAMRRPSQLSFIFALLLTTLRVHAQSPGSTERPASTDNASFSAKASELTARVKKQLVFLPGGTFEMGDWGNEQGLPYDGEENSRPLHKVTLDGFSMMAYKVSYDDFDVFTDAVGEQRIIPYPGDAKNRMPRKAAGANWYGAKAYCEWLGQLTGLPFDLPTEAQWEYAARSGGRKVLFATDNGKVDKNRNFPWDRRDGTTPELGSFPPNAIGLYGMLDFMASEWVNDWYDPDYYKQSLVNNPKGPKAGKPSQVAHPELGPAKVIRGGPTSQPAFGGFVFSRTGRTPRETRSEFIENFHGFSGWRNVQFRCVVNQSHPAK